ncbi:unnamed protein product [Rhodiola kirilowii]
MGFLLRNAPVDQLMKGIESVMLEVAEKAFFICKEIWS